MSEAEWIHETAVDPLLDAVTPCSSIRKIRLFACACVRSLLPTDLGPNLHDGVVAAEQVSDGEENGAVLRMACNQIDFEPHLGTPNQHLAHALCCILSEGRYLVGRHMLLNLRNYIDQSKLDLPHFGLSQLRDVFGNPFRPIDFAPWRTDTVVTVAGQMYDSREFSAMPILADALQDAGCDNTEVLNHCRDANQTHVRGCWVVDGVLGKE